jgi:hypothetical protein
MVSVAAVEYSADGGRYGTVLVLMFMSCTSAISSQLIGVSTVLSYDVYKTCEFRCLPVAAGNNYDGSNLLPVFQIFDPTQPITVYFRPGIGQSPALLCSWEDLQACYMVPVSILGSYM